MCPRVTLPDECLFVLATAATSWRYKQNASGPLSGEPVQLLWLLLQPPVMIAEPPPDRARYIQHS